jgi:hypothetical protein
MRGCCKWCWPCLWTMCRTTWRPCMRRWRHRMRLAGAKSIGLWWMGFRHHGHAFDPAPAAAGPGADVGSMLRVENRSAITLLTTPHIGHPSAKAQKHIVSCPAQRGVERLCFQIGRNRPSNGIDPGLVDTFEPPDGCWNLRSQSESMASVDFLWSAPPSKASPHAATGLAARCQQRLGPAIRVLALAGRAIRHGCSMGCPPDLPGA